MEGNEMTTTHLLLDTVFDLFANRRRRCVLYYLAEVEGETVIKVEDITTQIKEWEQKWDVIKNPAPPDSQETIRIDLHHNHLPRLADAALIDYDARTETIRNWGPPSIDHWLHPDHPKLPHLRALFSVADA